MITHAPWGEYGHEDHVQLFRAVDALRAELGFALWVPAYVSDRSAALMRRNLGRLGAPTAPMPTDRALGERLKALYRETGAWTWVDDHAWPDTEVFYPVLPGPAAAAVAGPQLPGDRRHDAGRARARPRRAAASPGRCAGSGASPAGAVEPGPAAC